MRSPLVISQENRPLLKASGPSWLYQTASISMKSASHVSFFGTFINTVICGHNGHCHSHCFLVLANRPERECPSRRYVFERHARKRLKLPPSDLKEIMVTNRTECEDKCLGEFSFVCRSATYDSALRTCSLSRFTRRTHPELLEDDHNADYLENTCLNGK